MRMTCYTLLSHRLHKAAYALLKVETKEILMERIALDEAQTRAALAEPRHDEGDINTDDDETDDGQMRDYMQWKKRELARIAR